MIKTVADILLELIRFEQTKLDQVELRHGPTIGAMYEGLTADILERAIPPQLNLQVVSGFICHGETVVSGEIDCMLVKGEGIRVPHTQKVKCQIRDVLAVIEVKKKLYARDLLEAFYHLSEVIDGFSHYVQSDTSHEVLRLPAFRRAFEQTTRRIAPPIQNGSDNLPFSEAAIYDLLIIEHASPLRVILGYHGFKSESSFRAAMVRLVRKNLRRPNFGPMGFPQLVIAGSFSLIKLNGLPSISAVRPDGYWDLHVSTSANPLLLLLELLWTRIEQVLNVSLPWGEDLKTEELHPLMQVRPVKQGSLTGWDYKYVTLTPEQLALEHEPVSWQPVFLDVPEFTVVNSLCHTQFMLIGDLSLIGSPFGRSGNSLLSSLLGTGLIATDQHQLTLSTEKCDCLILPTGECVAAENNSGRLARWLPRKLAELKNRP